VCRFIFNFAIVNHAKTADFLDTRWHTKILVGTLPPHLQSNVVNEMQYNLSFLPYVMVSSWSYLSVSIMV